MRVLKNPILLAVAFLMATLGALICPAQQREQIDIDAHAATTPFPHFWEEMFGSGRAALVLRTAYQDDVTAVKAITDFKYVRFHAILHDELAVYNEDEEGGAARRPFHGQFGLRATGNINKPSFYDFALLHQLGTERIANPSHNALVTRMADGSLAIALWNLASVVEPPESVTTHDIKLHITGLSPSAVASMQRVDSDHSDVLKIYTSMGSPQYPTRAQAQQMNAATALPPPEPLGLHDGTLDLNLIPNELVLLHIGASANPQKRPSKHSQE